MQRQHFILFEVFFPPGLVLLRIYFRESVEVLCPHQCSRTGSDGAVWMWRWGVHCKSDARKRRVAGEDRVHVPNSITSGRWDNAATPAQMMAAGVNTVVHLSSPPACSCLKLWAQRGVPAAEALTA